MFEQINLFDMIQSPLEIPEVNAEGYIPSSELHPIRWEAWKYFKKDWTLNGGAPYIISAMLAILPGNRLYVKEWMLYPFMHELKSSEDVERMYHAIRKKIIEREERNDENQRTWQVEEMPPLEDMWQYEKGEYSCKEYAGKMLHGYGVSSMRE